MSWPSDWSTKLTIGSSISVFEGYAVNIALGTGLIFTYADPEILFALHPLSSVTETIVLLPALFVFIICWKPTFETILLTVFINLSFLK